MPKNIPVKDADFDKKQELITAYVAQRRQAWGISIEWYTELLNAKMQWVTKYAIMLNPDTRTKPATAAKNRAREVYEGYLSQLIQMLLSNPAVTQEDLDKMEITGRSGGYRPVLPPPGDAPGMHVDTSTASRLKVTAYGEAGLTRGRPPGATGHLVFWKITKEEPIHLSDYTHTMYSSEATLVLDFDMAQSGETVVLCSCWVNVKGERSPISKPIKVVIP